MYSVTRLLDVVENDRDRVLVSAAHAAAAATEARHQLVAATLPGARNGGDILVHLRFDNEDQWRCVETDFATTLTDPAITRVNGAAIRVTLLVAAPGPAPCIARCCCASFPAPTPETIARFEDELRLMPRYVNTITAWQLSSVDEPVGTTQSALTSSSRSSPTWSRSDGPLSDAPDPLGGGRTARSTPMSRCHRPRPRMPFLLRDGRFRSDLIPRHGLGSQRSQCPDDHPHANT